MGTLKFLPLNLGYNSARPLAAVDDVVYDELLSFLWRATPGKGIVYRRYSDTLAGHEAKRQVLLRERLKNRIAGVGPEACVIPLNGDELDCRKENLSVRDPADIPVRQQLEWVSSYPGYSEALQDIERRREEFRMLARPRQEFAVSLADVRKFLDSIWQSPDTWVGQLSIPGLRDHFNEVTGRWISNTHVSRILSGASCHIPGYNYKRVKAARISPRERALRHQAELHGEEYTPECYGPTW